MNIARHLDGGAWVYDDDELNDVVLLWLFDYGVNLADFDDWIDARDTAPARRVQLLRWRQRAIDAQLAGNDDAAEGWVRFLGELHKRIAHFEVLRRPAVLGERSSAAHKHVAKADRKLNTSLRNRIRTAYADRMSNGEKYGAIKALMAQFGLSRTTISKIVNSNSSEN